MFPVYIFKAKIAFSDHAFPGLTTVQRKATKDLCGGGGKFIKLLSVLSEHLFKRIRPFRIAYLKSGCRICVCLKVRIKIMEGIKSSTKVVVDIFKII